MASAAALRYAFINPGIPSLVPPKYLITTIKILVRLFDCIWPNIGGPDEFDGSPSSLQR